jgi:hypothetical protein
MVEEFGGAVLEHHSFKTMAYNKPHMKNPHFVMLNEPYNTPAFIFFLKELIQ